MTDMKWEAFWVCVALAIMAFVVYMLVPVLTGLAPWGRG